MGVCRHTKCNQIIILIPVLNPKSQLIFGIKKIKIVWARSLWNIWLYLFIYLFLNLSVYLKVALCSDFVYITFIAIIIPVWTCTQCAYICMFRLYILHRLVYRRETHRKMPARQYLHRTMMTTTRHIWYDSIQAVRPRVFPSLSGCLYSLRVWGQRTSYSK